MSTVEEAGGRVGTAAPAVYPPSSLGGARPVLPSRGALRPLGLDEVVITGGALGQFQQRNAEASLDHIEGWLERSGWLGNFDAATAGLLPQQRQGREFSDSEIYKFLEALAWEFGRTGDPLIDARFRAIAARVIAAQEPDGYLNTKFGRPGQGARYSDLEWGHELYCFGHLIQAGVARARTVGEDDFVRAVRAAADHVCRAFGPGGDISSVCGHPEIEPALVELYRVTGERRYLEQARLFVQLRGHQVLDDIEFGRSYFQDDIPIDEAQVLRGHAVRALYLSAGAVDVATETSDEALLEALARQWDRTVARRTYLTGGMGSHHQDEAFGADFELPSDRSYSETCAGIGSIMFAWRLLLARGRVRYADLIERTLYNVIAGAVAEDGRAFFYTNTLHQRVLGSQPEPGEMVQRADSSLRAPWYSVSCCPNNLARTFASLAGYLATVDAGGVQVHQYASATVRTVLPDGRPVAFEVQTRYPDDGRIVITTTGADVGSWSLTLRVPNWAVAGAQVSVCGATASDVGAGYVRITHDFRPGDTVELRLPMEPRLVAADPRVDAVRGCVAVERGPEVLCLESIDTPQRQHVDLFCLDDTPPVEIDGRVRVGLRRISLTEPDPGPGEQPPGWPYRPVQLGGVEAVVPADGLQADLLPYRHWGNRGPTTMRVWLPVVPGGPVGAR